MKEKKQVINHGCPICILDMEGGMNLIKKCESSKVSFELGGVHATIPLPYKGRRHFPISSKESQTNRKRTYNKEYL